MIDKRVNEGVSGCLERFRVTFGRGLTEKIRISGFGGVVGVVDYVR